MSLREGQEVPHGISGFGAPPPFAVENHNSSRSNKSFRAAGGPPADGPQEVENHNSSRSNRGQVAAAGAGGAGGAAVTVLADLSSKLDSVGQAGTALGAAIDKFATAGGAAEASSPSRLATDAARLLQTL